MENQPYLINFPLFSREMVLNRRLFRDLDNPNIVLIIIEWDNQENAKNVLESEDLLQRFQKGGIIDIDIHHVKEIENRVL